MRQFFFRSALSDKIWDTIRAKAWEMEWSLQRDTVHIFRTAAYFQQSSQREGERIIKNRESERYMEADHCTNKINRPPVWVVARNVVKVSLLSQPDALWHEKWNLWTLELNDPEDKSFARVDKKREGRDATMNFIRNKKVINVQTERPPDK